MLVVLVVLVVLDEVLWIVVEVDIGGIEVVGVGELGSGAVDVGKLDMFEVGWECMSLGTFPPNSDPELRLLDG